ncbi:hypothetical protein Dimus_026336 [Dionaea muscipula]
MDPCHFVRITVGNLALKFPAATNAAAAVATSKQTYVCVIKFKGFPHQTATVPLLPATGSDFPGNEPPSSHLSVSACFSLSISGLDRVLDKSKRKKKHPNLKIHVYACGGGGGGGKEEVANTGGNRSSGKKSLGRVVIPLDLSHRGESGTVAMMTRASVLCSGWVAIEKSCRKKLLRMGKEVSSDQDHPPQLHASVKAEADPRFVFEFDGEPECSPQVFQVQGKIRQPVFTCKFTFKNPAANSSSSMSEPSTSNSWLSSFLHWHRGGLGRKMRKGWSITIHDLSGSPVAAACIIAPFMPLPGSNRVSKHNPGAWLVLRPGEGTWKPWGRLEAWRERGITDGLGYRFDLLPDTVSGAGPNGLNLSNGTISAKSGGNFRIDVSTSSSPINSPNGSFDLGSGSGSGSGSESGGSAAAWWWPHFLYRGFVMSSTVVGKRKGSSKAPKVEVGAQHVTCTEDAAVFVALAAAMDLSMDACRLFSKKLRKELRPHGEASS